ncbi:PPOX class F420-dependent oxidoreductase [Blastococcus sp. KM273128]|uniref:PPOX class F420-dependent oxidoreductase n=1 Tax=Blastococcus sp. KM273128 TaxID=2570314 RepID=UPI001F01E099|nr:PPOX class F420-dependent oxidoreductase [Blastococcus sp. KM273128]MCF6744064.1 PPOX class F420-dependent oxidoreductase [Blastococcus sp. KM273128]
MTAPGATASTDSDLRPTATLSADEIAYLLGERRLGRLATADATGRPHVVPVGWSYNAELGTIDISGHGFAATRKYRNAAANPQAAFVVDDVLPPFRPRCVMVQGPVETLDADRSGGREAMIRIHPDKVVSWGLDA